MKKFIEINAVSKGFIIIRTDQILLIKIGTLDSYNGTWIFLSGEADSIKQLFTRESYESLRKSIDVGSINERSNKYVHVKQWAYANIPKIIALTANVLRIIFLLSALFLSLSAY